MDDVGSLEAMLVGLQAQRPRVGAQTACEAAD